VNPAEPQRMRLELRLALKPNDAREALERWFDLTAEHHQSMTERMPRASPTGPAGHGVSTRRTQDWRVCTAVCDTAAVGTIIWNPWKPSAQMCSSAAATRFPDSARRATASSRNTSELRRGDIEVEALPTAEAVCRYQQLEPSRPAAALHLTCRSLNV